MIPTYKSFRIGAVETGARGKPGKSAYELWLENGNKGTIEGLEPGENLEKVLTNYGWKMVTKEL
ncbi:hypothetical protein [Clostridium phage vB_CpeP_15N3]|nr:hypothetical protein [Clostridium phage XP15-N3]